MNSTSSNSSKKLILLVTVILVFLVVMLATFITRQNPTPVPTPSPSPAPDSIIGYTCPKTEWIDCMPGPPEAGIRWQCTEEYLNWAKKNCPNFKGVAY